MKILLERAKLHGEAHAKRTAKAHETALRDIFAGVALSYYLPKFIPEDATKISYQIADLMLEAHKKKKGVQDA